MIKRKINREKDHPALARFSMIGGREGFDVRGGD
jgi:hypothetical protein